MEILIYLVIFTIIFFKLKIRNRNRIIKLFKFIFKLGFFPIRIIFKIFNYYLKKYLKNKRIKDKEIEREKIKKQRIENKIKLLQNKMNNEEV